MSAAAVFSRTCRTFRHAAHLRHASFTQSINPAFLSFSKRYMATRRDRFDEIEDRDLRDTPVAERGLTREEFEALSAEEQAEIRDREQELIDEEGEPFEVPLLTQEEIDQLDDEQRKLYLEFIEAGGSAEEAALIFREDEELDDEVDEDDEFVEVDEDEELEVSDDAEHDENEMGEYDESDVPEEHEEFDEDELTEEFGDDIRDVDIEEGEDEVGLEIRDVDPEIEQLEEQYAASKYGLTDVIDQFEEALDDAEIEDAVRDEDDVRIADIPIDPSLFAKRTGRNIPQVPGLDYAQNQPITRPKAISSDDPNARRDPEPQLEPYGVRQERSSAEMIDRAIRAGPAVHQSSFIDHEANTPLTPHWMHMQTSNPELIPPKRGANYEDPTSVKYPFIPVLESQRDLEEASLLHRLLQYNRLDATKKFLKLERIRRQLAYQRQHRDLSAYCKKLCAKLPAERVDLKDVKPKIKNLPTHVSSDYLKEMHPHNIPTDTAWMHSLMWLVHDNVKDNGKLSQLEKEQYLRTTQRFCSYAYRQMMKDKADGYYRIMSTPPMMDTKEEQDAKNPPPPKIPSRMQSSLLRQAKILIQQSTAQ